MFDIGLPELIVIMVIILLVVGPEDIPRILYRLGKFVRYVSGHWNSMRKTLGDVMHEAEINEYRIKANEEKDKVVKDLMADFEPEKAVDDKLRTKKKKPATKKKSPTKKKPTTTKKKKTTVKKVTNASKKEK